MAKQTPTPGSRPSEVRLPPVRGKESKKHGGSQASWRSSY